MRHTKTVVIMFLIMALGLVSVASVAFAAPPEGKGRPAHDEIVAYWTPDRIANAKPREISPTGRPDFAEPQRPGNGGGGNGGGKGGGGNGGGD